MFNDFTELVSSIVVICWPGQASPTEWNNIIKVLKHIQLEEHQSVTLAAHPLPDGGDQRPHPDSLPWATRPVFTGLLSEDEDDDQQPIKDEDDDQQPFQDTPKKTWPRVRSAMTKNRLKQHIVTS